MHRPLSRRELLRSTTGVALGLPFLEAMLPVRASARSAAPAVRLVWLHTESGMWMPHYKPTTTGRAYALSPTLEPLAPLRNEVTVLSGLWHENAFKRNPQTGRHAQDGMCHLTGADLSATPGVAVKNSISVDQLAAEQIGERTRIPVLNLSVEGNATLSYSSGGVPLPSEWNPKAVFARLFSDNSHEARLRQEARFQRHQSVLDDVLEATHDLSRTLGTGDRQKIDEYLTNVREVERRLRVARKWADMPPVLPPTGVTAPPALPNRNRTAHIRMLMDMLVLALQTDQTRLATLRIGFMSCMYPEINCPDSYHGYTHHDFKKERQEAMAHVDRYRIEHLAYLAQRLKSVREGEHDLLYHCVVHYGAGMGMDHETTDLANLLVGQGGGSIKAGQHLDYQKKPLSNLYVRMLQSAGLKTTRFSDSTGSLEGF